MRLEDGVVLERVLRNHTPEEHRRAVASIRRAYRRMRKDLPEWDYTFEVEGNAYLLRAKPSGKFSGPEMMGAFFVGALAGLLRGRCWE